MKVKLTLLLDEAVVKEAKEISKATGKSISKMVEEYFTDISKKKSIENDDIHPEVRKLMGIGNLEDKRDYKEILAEEIVKKYS